MAIVDWNVLNAPEVPKWLVALSSKDEKWQYHAKLALSSYLKQHALALNIANYEYNEVLATDAPVLITSFLIEMLRVPSLAKPATITELLEVVSLYGKEPTLGYMQQKRATKIHNLLVQQFDLFLHMLTYPDPEVRGNILNLLHNIPEKQEELAKVLLHHLEVNHLSEKLERLIAIDVLFEIVRKDEYADDLLDRYIRILSQWFENYETLPIILARSGCYLILLQGEEVSQVIVDILVDILKEANFTDPLEDLGLSDLWIEALLTFGANQATRIFLDLFDHQTDDYALIEISAILLDLHFRSGDFRRPYLLMDKYGDETRVIASLGESQNLSPISQPKSLSDLQKEILRQLVHKDQLWDIKTNLFELYSLPATRSKLSALITDTTG